MTAFPEIPIVYGMRRLLRVNVKQIRRVDLKVERLFINRHVQHAFEIPWQALEPAERTTLDSYFASVRGRALANIDFTDPWDDVHYTCRFDDDTIQTVENESNRWASTIRLIEVADFKPMKAAVPAFPAFPSGSVVQLPYTMRRTYRTEINTQEDDSEFRFEDYATASGIQSWTVGGDFLDDDYAVELLDTWEGNAGPWKAMTFTEPETGAPFPAVHFVESEITHELAQPCANLIRLTLEELK